MGRGRAGAKLLDIADAQAGGGERQPGQCLFECDGQCVSVVRADADVDAEGAEQFEIAVETADVDFQTGEQEAAQLRPVPQEGQKFEQAGGTLSREGD